MSHASQKARGSDMEQLWEDRVSTPLTHEAVSREPRMPVLSFRLVLGIVGFVCVVAVGLVVFGISWSAGTTGIATVERDLRTTIVASIMRELGSWCGNAFKGVNTLAEEI